MTTETPKENKLTIGDLAKAVGVRTSALRYYEKEGLLTPADRSESGYRQYTPTAVSRVRLIQRAQRLGFSLSDIRPLLEAWDTGNLNDEAISQIAEQRYLALEEQVTERLVLQHELALFLQDLDKRINREFSGTAFDKLLERICADPDTKMSAGFMLDWMMDQINCKLSSEKGRKILKRLTGRHLHVWQEKDAYQVLFVGKDPDLERGLSELTTLESNCEPHAATFTSYKETEQGFQFTANGENAFIFARLFLVLSGQN